MQAAEKDLRTSVKSMKKRISNLLPQKSGPLCHEEIVQITTKVDDFRNDVHKLSEILNVALSLTTKPEGVSPTLSALQVSRSSPSTSDSGNESCFSENAFSSSPSSSILNEGLIARLNASRVSSRIKSEELRLSLEKSERIEYEIKKRLAESTARRASLG